MALIQKRRSNQTLFIILGVGAALAILLLIFRDRLFGGPSTEDLPVVTTPSDLPIVTDLGEELFKDSRFTTLQGLPTDSPVPSTVGRDQPFTPL